MIPPLDIRDHPEGATFTVRVQPGARKTAITGTFGNALKVAVAAAPAEGQANQALIEFCSEVFRVPRSSVHLIAGAGSRSKILRIRGRTAAELALALRAHFTV